jgi:hypothetical protein
MLEECVQDGTNVGDDVQSVHHGQIWIAMLLVEEARRNTKAHKATHHSLFDRLGLKRVLHDA